MESIEQNNFEQPQVVDLSFSSNKSNLTASSILDLSCKTEVALTETTNTQNVCTFSISSKEMEKQQSKSQSSNFRNMCNDNHFIDDTISSQCCLESKKPLHKPNVYLPKDIQLKKNQDNQINSMLTNDHQIKAASLSAPFKTPVKASVPHPVSADAITNATRPFKAYPNNPFALNASITLLENDDWNRAYPEFREKIITKLNKSNNRNTNNRMRKTSNSVSSTSTAEVPKGKDAAYLERRRKNNEAAKRSRDARRAKEDELAIYATFLQQQNMKLRNIIKKLQEELKLSRHNIVSNSEMPCTSRDEQPSIIYGT